MKNLFSLNISDLEKYFLSIGEKKFKAIQVFEWLYIHKEYNIDNFSNLKKELRDKLKNDFNTNFISIKRKEEDKLTKKYLFELSDHNYVEAVLMDHDYGKSVCVSSEVGCNMGCKFCESGRLKKVRNLETYEMVQEIILIEDDIKEKIDSVVIMGIGEPFDNYLNVINFIKIINHPKGLGIGARHITVSTCGLVPKIDEFSNLDLQVNLALSLHAPNDEIRNKIMPVNKVYNISAVLEAIKRYIAKTNRRVTIEYVMLDMVNDSIECADMLADLLKGMNVYVNLIPYNETNNIDFKKSNNIDVFKNELIKKGINVTVRREFGSKISAACGQLRSKEV
jgi:23S rRNA (adenine2503-C2)-methyltransferase